MPATGRQAERLQMLIDVAVTGDKKMKNLATAAKKLAVETNSLGKGLEHVGSTFSELKGKFSRIITAVNDLKTAEDKLEKAQRRITKGTHANGRAIKGFETSVRNARQAQEDWDLKARAAAKTLRNLTGITGVYNTKAKRANYTVEELKDAIQEYRDEIKGLTDMQRAESKAQRRATSVRKRANKTIKDQNAAVKRGSKEWGLLNQRVDTSGKDIFNRMRRRLGSIRNILLVVAFATRGLREAFNAAFEATLKLESAMRGLSSVAVNMGIASSEANDAAMALAKDGLLTVQEAAAGLKNLLATGMGMPEAIKMMEVFTDSAAFNRQGTLGLGEAIVGATQGIKNQNSIMVDNAGITKNLSIMQKEYAASIGTTIGKLTEAQKKQAIINGIMKEGALFAGDSEKVLTTLSGTMAQLAAKTFTAAASIGDVLRPAIVGAVQAYTKGIEAVEAWFVAHKAELMEDAAAAGKTLGSVISSLGKGMGIALQGLYNFLRVLEALGTSGGAILRAVAALKIWNVMSAKVNLTLKETVIASNMNTKTMGVWHTKNKAFVGGLKTLIPLQRFFNKELIASGVAGSKFTLNIRAMIMALRAYRGAVAAAKVATRTFVASLGMFAAVFIGLEVLIRSFMWIWDKLFKISFKEAERAANRMTKENERAAASFKKLSQAMGATATAGGAAGLDVAQYNAQLQSLKNHQDKIQAARAEFAASRDLERQAELEEEIQDLTDAYDDQFEVTKRSQIKIQGLVQDYYNRLKGYSTEYQDAMEDRYKETNVDEILEWAQRHQAIISSQEKFNKDMEILGKTDLGRAKIMIEQRKLVEIQTEEGFNQRIEKQEKAHANNMLKLTEQVAKIRAGITHDAFAEIEASTSALQKKMINDLDATVGKLMKHYEDLGTLGKTATASAKAGLTGAFAQASGGPGEAKAKAMQVQFGKMAPELKEAYRGLKDIYDEFDKGGKTSEEAIKKLAEYAATAEKFSQAPYSQDTIAEANILKGVVEQLGPAYKKYHDELVAADKITEGHAAGVRDLTIEETLMEQAIEKLIEDLKVYKEQNEHFKQDLKEQIHLAKAKELELEKQAREKLNIANQDAFDLDQKMLDVTRRSKEMKVKDALLDQMNIPLWGELIVLKRQQAIEVEKLELATKAERIEMVLNIEKLEAQKAAYDEMIKNKEKYGGITNANVQAAMKESERLQIQIDQAIAAGEAFDKLAAAKSKALQSEADQEALEMQIDTFMKLHSVAQKMYTTQFANWVTREKEKRSRNREFAKLLKEGRINEEQEQRLRAASGDLAAAQEKYQNEKMKIDLIRNIGSQIMAWAALHAAKLNPAAAAVMLAVAAAGTYAIASVTANMENEANKEYERAQAKYEEQKADIIPEGEEGASEEAKKFGGTIKAESLQVSISPTVVIQGEQVFIGQGSVTEFSTEMQAMLLTMTNEAIENRELDVSALQGIGG